MFRNIFKGALIYMLVLVFVVPVIVLFLFGNLSKKVNVGTKPQNISDLTSTPISETSTPIVVPLPSKEDVVRTFCDLIDEGRVSEAVGMMDVADDATMQAWGSSLNSFSSFKLVTINKSLIDESGNSFEVDINVRLKSGNESYGWVNGINKKWINLVDVGLGRYKIKGIATGP